MEELKRTQIEDKKEEIFALIFKFEQTREVGFYRNALEKFEEMLLKRAFDYFVNDDEAMAKKTKELLKDVKQEYSKYLESIKSDRRDELWTKLNDRLNELGNLYK